MIHRRTPALAGAALALGMAALPASSQQPLDLARAAHVADSLASALVASRTVPGLTVAIAHRGETVLLRGYGQAVVENGAAAGPETVYGISSLTKQVTAATILRLVDAGRISLDDPISRYLPDYPLQGRIVTVRQLLNHTSGIFAMRNASDVDDPDWFRRDLSYAQMVELFGSRPFEFEPGTRYAYNNLGYYLLGELIARVTGRSYAEHVEAEMREMGLTSVHFCDARRAGPRHARAYEARGDQFRDAPHVSMHIFGGAGALCATAGDLVKWSTLLHGGRVLSPASLAAMTAPGHLADGRATATGMGLDVDAFEGQARLHHGGTTPWGAYMAHYPGAELTVAVLTNAAAVGREQGARLEEAVARAALGREIADLPMTAEEMAVYAGTYVLRLGEQSMPLRVFVENGMLMAQAGGQEAGRLRAQGGHAFIHAADAGIRLVFTVDGGRATGVTLHQRGREIPGERQP